MGEKTKEELEESKRKARETNMFSCDKCGEMFDSVSINNKNNLQMAHLIFKILFSNTQFYLII